MEHVIENQQIRVVLGDNGSLLSLADKRSDIEYVKSHGLWRLIINEGESLEIELKAENSQAEVSINEESFSICYNQPMTHTGHHVDITVQVNGRLEGEDIKLDISMDNRSKSIIRECHFPIIELSDQAGEMDLHSSHKGGCVWKHLKNHLDNPNDVKLYKAMEYVYHRKTFSYPSSDAATNSLALADADQGLYFGCHDNTFKFTDHIVEIEDKAHLNLAMVQCPFVKPGTSDSISEFRLSPYQGAWHKAADKYRTWAETWYDFKKAPDAIRTTLGWQRIIMRSQYGENFYTYDQLPQIFEDGIKAGIDTLFMFGWYKGGHDNDYPNYTVSEDLGGYEVLKQNIAEFKRRGGKVILYSNGQLIDRNSDYYLNGNGKKVSVKDHNGNEQQEFYGFSGRGIFNKRYGNRTFVTGCSASEDWCKQLMKVVDTAAELGCDGVFYDQLGTSAYLCCDPTHGHPVPFFGIMNARRDLVKKLREYAKSKGLHFGIELITDITAQHTDYIHTLAGGATVTDPLWEKKGEKPNVMINMDWFRYIFPEVIISNREIRDDTDIERRVNRMIMQNLISDVEIYRCQKTIAEAPHYQEYLGKANAFRKKHSDLMSGAKFRSTSLHKIDNDQVDSEGHIAPDGSIVVMATQSHLDSATVNINVPGRALKSHDFLNNGTLNTDGSITLERHGLVMLIFG